MVYDSEVGLFIQLEEEGFYEFLVLCLFLGEGFFSGVEDGRVVQVFVFINLWFFLYQCDGVKFFYNFYREGRGGIFGDDM